MTLLALLAFLQADPAELYRAMCRTLDSAASVRYEFESQVTQDDKQTSASGALRIQSHHVRLDVTLRRDGAGKQLQLFVFSGMATEIEDGRVLEAEEAQPEAARLFRSGISRTGVVGLTYLAGTARFSKKRRNDVPDVGKLESSAFESAGEELLGDRKARKVRYSAVLKNATSAPLLVTVWIDAERLVPLKRTIEQTDAERRIAIVETTTRCEINPALGDDEFKPGSSK